jgi:excinuclease ABC A subunit
MSRGGQPSTIAVIGADANNLRCVNVDFPLGGVTVVTGVSGSGKSSLLAETVAAEGSRRTRTFLGISQRELEREDVGAYVGPMPPCVFVGQRGFRPSARTTVGTATGFLSVLRRLFLLAGRPRSDRAGADIPPPDPETYAGWLSSHYRGSAQIWASPIRQKRTDGLSAIDRLRRHGLRVVQVYSETDPPNLQGKGREHSVDGFRPLNPNVQHTIEAPVAQVKVDGRGDRGALLEALKCAFEAGRGSVVVMLDGVVDPALKGPFGARLDSERHWVHPATPEIFFRPSIHLLSFNAPAHDETGACPACLGTGTGRRLREERLVIHPERAMRDGAFSLWTERNYKYLNIQHETINGLEGVTGFSADRPWSSLPAEARALILDGAGDEPIQDLDARGRKFGRPRPFRGFRRAILDKAAGASGAAEALMPLVEEGPCEMCGGTRWSFQARALRVGALGIDRILATPFGQFEDVAPELRNAARVTDERAESLVVNLEQRAAALRDVGLGYLAADRGMLNVSGGESRRIRLARVIGAAEAGLCLLFDEPARGLHECDLPGLGSGLERLQGRHTVILNEHREQLWRIANTFIEVGPGAGAAGGQIVRCGRPPKPSTGRNAPPLPPLRSPVRGKALAIMGASLHNLRGVDCAIPLGLFTCICGVSGSGKSSFVRGVLAPAAAAAARGEALDAEARAWRSASGLDLVEATVILDQQMPPPNRRSLVATATGVYDGIRKAFAASPAAKKEGLAASDFSINSGGGRCDLCLGLGIVGEAETAGRCPACGGSRFGPEVLAVRAHGFNVRELLETPVEALQPIIHRFGVPPDLLETMSELGIGYLTLGRRTDSLSGGELQRLLLAIRLAAPSAVPTLFILDEPAAGLHPDDVRVLIRALERVVAGGRHSLVVIDHDLELIRNADWLIEFGPGAGEEGGEIVFEGTAEALFHADTATGRALRGQIGTTRTSRKRRLTDRGRSDPAPEARAARVEALLRTLITGDVLPGTESGEGAAEPVVLIEEDRWAQFANWEVAGLDKELPKLLIDLQRPSAAASSERLLEAWRREPGARLAVQPYLSDIAVWGDRVPKSVTEKVARRMKKEGLRVEALGGTATPAIRAGVKALRASGDRFAAPSATDEERRGALRDALAIGSGYAELRSPRGALLATAGDRMVDLDSGLVGPARPVPADFSRHEARGRCPGCSGTGAVATIEERLLVRTDAASPLDPAFLTPEAEAVSRSVRRAMLVPFLRRLEKEGLLDDAGAPFRRWAEGARAMLLHGCWTRPGAGTFLKNARADPGEVSSWLRWDGLYREIMRELGRSKHARWAEAVRGSAFSATCPTCAGTGLKPHAALLSVGGIRFPKWTGVKDARKYALLGDVLPKTARQRATHARLLECLKPLRAGGAKHEVVERAVKAFTTMPSVRVGR